MAKGKTTQEILGEKLSLKRVVAEINKAFGTDTMGDPAGMGGGAIIRLKTGIAKFDEALGGGFPMGRMVELFGEKSAGKTLTALLAIKNAQAMGRECVFIDAEGSYEPAWAKSWGIDVDKLVVVKLNVTEDVFDIIVDFLKANPGVIVVDSVAALISKSELENDTEQQQIAMNARIISKALKKLVAHNQDTLIIFINQIRVNLTAMGAFGFKTPGGLALEHNASIRIHMKKEKEPIFEDGKKSGKQIGQTALYKVEKNKTGDPGRDGTFKLLYDGPRIEE